MWRICHVRVEYDLLLASSYNFTLSNDGVIVAGTPGRSRVSGPESRTQAHG